MKFCDSRLDDSTEELFERLGRELHAVEELRLVDTAWLNSPELRDRLEPLLIAIRARGGRIIHAGGPASEPKYA